MTSATDRELELRDRIQQHGISEAAIAARIRTMKKTGAGLTEEQWRTRAASYLCQVTEELQEYGATVTWP